MTSRHSRGVPYLWALSIALVFPPLLVVLHEAGHYSAARLLGYRARFGYGEVTYFPTSAGSADDWLITIAGPAVEAGFACIGVAWLLVVRRSSVNSSQLRVWVYSAFAGAGLRWFKTIFQGHRSDEAHLSAMFGFHPLAFPIVMLLPSTAVAIMLLRFHLRCQSLSPLFSGFVCGVLSVMAWFTIIGPLMLPKE